MNDIQNLETELSGFVGTLNYYPHWLKCFNYTDGVKYLADQAQCYWLIDVVASYQGYQKIKAVAFQVWELTVNDDQTAVVVMKDMRQPDMPAIVKQEIPYTDFPLKTIKLYLTNKVLFLPSED